MPSVSHQSINQSQKKAHGRFSRILRRRFTSGLQVPVITPSIRMMIVRNFTWIATAKTKTGPTHEPPGALSRWILWNKPTRRASIC